jgi:hypothetical protein
MRWIIAFAVIYVGHEIEKSRAKARPLKRRLQVRAEGQARKRKTVVSDECGERGKSRSLPPRRVRDGAARGLAVSLGRPAWVEE